MSCSMNRKFKKCFIAGITGSGGSYLAEYISKNEKKVKIYGSYRSLGFKKELKEKINNINLFKVDLNNFKLTKKTLSKIKPDLIYNFASDADVRGSFDDPINNSKNNVTSCVNLLQSIRELDLKCLYIHCSTSEVYGNVSKKDLPVKENQKFNPINPYAVTKAYQDFMTQVFSKSFKMKTIITRMFTYNNARRTNLFQTAFAKQIVEFEKKGQKKGILYHGNLDSKRCHLDINDAMSAYWLVAQKGKIGEIYNISGKKVLSVKKYLDHLIDNTNVKINKKLNKKLVRPIDIPLQLPNSNKFKKHTGWKERISFHKSLENFMQECRERY